MNSTIQSFFLQGSKVIILYFLFGVVTSGCKKADPTEFAEDAKWLEERMLKLESQKVEILAAKHGVTYDLAEEVIKTYRSRHDLSYQLFLYSTEKSKSKDFQSLLADVEGGKVAETLEELKGKLGIDEHAAASLIFDYSIWTQD